MTMPSSGALNMGGTTTPQSVANELGLGLTTTISMNQAAVRTLAGVGGSGTTWSMNSLYGKSSFGVSLAELSGADFNGFPYSDNESYDVSLLFYTDGTWRFAGYAAGNIEGNWGTPATVGIGSNYWVKWTRTSFFSGSGNSASPTSGWLQLSSTQQILVVTAGITVATATYTIEISSDSGGSVVLASASGVTLTAQIFPG